MHLLWSVLQHKVKPIARQLVIFVSLLDKAGVHEQSDERFGKWVFDLHPINVQHVTSQIEPLFTGALLLVF